MGLRCEFVESTGKRCRKQQVEGARLCALHLKLRDEEDALGSSSLTGEIVQMRQLIRGLMDKGDFEAARRGIETLAKLVRQFEQQKAGTVPETSMDKVFEQLGAELLPPEDQAERR